MTALVHCSCSSAQYATSLEAYACLRHAYQMSYFPASPSKSVNQYDELPDLESTPSVTGLGRRWSLTGVRDPGAKYTLSVKHQAPDQLHELHLQPR
ncbi:Reducing polyketide synthase BOA9 [Fusarium oxysporum f. sp. albedinis]|nr:Reducing polyketide synthase BOA9 [Fusarium oxysporum f. sp. albedinis]